MDFIFGFSLTNVLLITIAFELFISSYGLSKRINILEIMLIEKGVIEHKDIKKNKHK